jgi:hypothetical protein
MIRQHLLDCLMAASLRTKTKGIVVKQRLEDRLQKPSNHFLSHAISDSRNAEWAKLRLLGVFGNVGPSEGHGLKRAFLHVPHQGLQVLVKVSLKHLDAHLVDTRGAAIPSHRFPSCID